MPIAPLPLVSARPMLRIDGQDAPDLDAALLEMQVGERSDGLAQAELAFGAWGVVGGGPGYALFDRRRLEFGKALELRIGSERVFSGRILALQGRFPEAGAGQAELVVLAEDALQDLRMTRRSRSFAQQSDADIARQIASDHGLSAQVSVSGPAHAVLAQVNQSDLAFLRERALRIGAELWLDDQGLHLAPRPARSSGAPLALNYGANLLSFDVRADLALQRSSLAVSGWDVAAKRALREQAEASVLSSELGDGDSGPALLQSTLGARPDTVAHLQPADAAEARAMAEAYLRQIGRRFVSGQGVAAPAPALRVGTTLRLGGLGPLFDGDYTATAVSHRFDSRRGLRTEFSVERPAIGRP